MYNLSELNKTTSLPLFSYACVECFGKHYRFETKALQEKCVDIALAVEMLYMATIPGAFDIAVIVTGDKDFMPALEKTRLLGKRVAICSMRNGCNGDLVRIENRIRDFEMIWLDDYLDELIVPKRDPQDKQGLPVLFIVVAALPCRT